MNNKPPDIICTFPKGVKRPEYLLRSSGRLVYGPKRPPRNKPSKSKYNHPHDEWWIILECDHDLSGLYRWFFKRYGKELYAPAWGTHISINRGEEPKYPEFWKAREGERLWFYYEPVFHTNGKHWWMHVYTDEFAFIRENLGLSKSAHSDWKRFHITIGKEFE